MAKAIKDFIIAFFTTFFTKWLADFLIFTGIALIIANTYLISVIPSNILAGNYLLGAVLIVLGVIFAKR